MVSGGTTNRGTRGEVSEGAEVKEAAILFEESELRGEAMQQGPGLQLLWRQKQRNSAGVSEQP